MTEEIDDLSYVKYALSLSSVLPEGIPEDFLPENITSLMHSKNWARVIINVRSAGESDDAFQFSDNIRAIIDKYYPNETTYLVGVTPSTQDIKDIIVPDYNRVNIVSLLGVALVYRDHLQGTDPADRRAHPDRVRDLHQHRSAVHLRSANHVPWLYHRRLYPAGCYG